MTLQRRKKMDSWRPAFMELAVRAIRRVHYEYSMWNLGSPGEINYRTLEKINQGRGFELADERAVCSAIVTEAISTRTLFGFIAKDKKPRKWNIEIEPTYTFMVQRKSKKSKSTRTSVKTRMRADFVICRDEKKPDGTDFEPAIIEAKRAKSHLLRSGRRKSSHNDLKKEMENLRNEAEVREIYGHILVWGSTRDKTEEHPELSDPVAFFKKFGLAPSIARWFPVEINQPGNPDKIKEIPTIQHWGWIALAQVTCPADCPRSDS